MNSPSGKILDHNVGLLLRRAYVPALPKPAFRAELERQWLAQVRRSALPAPGARPAPIRRLVPLAAAAAVLFGLFLAWTALGPRGDTPTAASLVADGRVALRVGSDARWRAATERELSHGIALAEEALALVVPEDVTVAVLVEPLRGEGGRLLAQGPAELSLLPENGRLRGTLAGGTVRMERAPVTNAAAGPWSLRTEPGRVLLDQGLLEVEKAGALERFLLQSGAARYQALGGETIELDPGRELRLFAGRPERAPELAARAGADDTGVGRRAVPDLEAPEDASVPAPTRLRSLQGRVLDADGAPVTSYRLALLHEREGNNFHTPEVIDVEDEGGRFTWDEAPLGNHDVFVQADGFALASLGRVSVGEQALPEFDVRLARGGAVRGHVVDSVTGSPVPGALVLSMEDTPQEFFLLDSADEGQWLPASARTLSDGSFELPHLSVGRHQLAVTAPGYGPIWTENPGVVEGGVRDGVLIELGAGGSLAGRVTHEDGTPHVGATVLAIVMDQVSSEMMAFVQVRTRFDGSYRIDDLPLVPMLAGMVDGQDDPAAARPRVRPFEPLRAETVTIDFLGHVEGVRLTGLLRDARGNPLPYQNITVFDKALSDSGADMEDFSATATASDGTYVFEELHPATYLVYAVQEHGRAIRFIQEIVVREGPVTRQDLQLSSCVLEGTVRDGRNGETVGSANLILEVEDSGAAGGGGIFGGNVIVEADGTFRIESLAPGRYVLTAYPEVVGLSYERSSELVVTEAEPRATFDFQLLAGGRVAVQVVDDRGRPVSGASVMFVDGNGHAHTFDRVAKTDDAGNYTAQGLRLESYRVIVRKQGHEDGIAVFACELDGTNGTDTVRVVLPADSAEQGTER